MSDCPDCQQLRDVIRDAEEANAELARQVAGLHRLLTRAGQTEVALRNELAKQREDEPEAELIKSVLNYWRTRLGHEKAKVPLAGDRAKKVRARLRDRFTVADLKKAIDGCAKMPYVGAGGRKATGTKRERHDDLILICRDEATVERFMAYADEAPAAPTQLRPSGPVGVDAILGKLEAVKEAQPGQWTAKCPAHDDRHASLSVAQGEKGAVLHCHTGCAIDDIAAAAGVEVTALFDREEPIAPAPAKRVDPLPGPEVVEHWQHQLATNQRLHDRLYELRKWTPDALTDLGVGWDGVRLLLPIYDPDGELVNLLRYLPARRNDEPKLLSLRGRPRDLFPQPAPDGEVWLVEGEPDAITGRQLGLPVSAVPGTNGWRSDWTPRLAGRRVVICMDCDEPGRKAAARIAADLRPVAAEVVTLDLEPERTDGYDLSDALLDGVDREFLEVMAGAIVQELAA